MRSLIAESDACLELLERLNLRGVRRTPLALRQRLARLSESAGYKMAWPPANPVRAHDFVLDLQGVCLITAWAEKPRPARPARRRRPRPTFGSLDWHAMRREGPYVTDPDWTWEVWREAADLARLHPTPARAAAMQEAWEYYWALVGADEPAQPERRAA